MKKIFALIAAIAFVATSSAQIVASYDFEDSTTKGWSVWNNKTNKIVQGESVKSGKNAMEIAIGTSFGFTSKTEKAKYKISADIYDKLGKTEAYMRVSYYNKAANNMIQSDPVAIPTIKGHSHFEHTFKAKKTGLYRVVFYGKSGRFIIDNVQAELVK